MKNQLFTRLCLFAVLILSLGISVLAQEGLLKRTTFKTETVEFGVGGTVSIVGAPMGSISVEGWNKNEIEISAEISVQAATENDLALLASVVGFITDDGFASTQIVSVGPHDRKYLKTVSKKFPKHLLAMPFRIDYKIRVPKYCDLEIDGGNGDLRLSNVEGMMRIKALETNATLDLVGGTVMAAFGKGNIEVNVPSASWRGRNLDIQLVTGTLSVNVPKKLNAEVDAKVLRTGQIENSLIDLKKAGKNRIYGQINFGKSGEWRNFNELYGWRRNA